MPGSPNIITNSTKKDEYNPICKLIPPNASVLDLGCGEGNLLDYLDSSKQIDGCGIEIEPDRITSAVSKGLCVIQGDLEELIKNYALKQFDYCILSNTIQELRDPEATIKEMLRVGRHVIITFYNVAYWKSRLGFLLRGTLQNHQTSYSLNSNIRFLSIHDFRRFCHSNQIEIEIETFNNSSEIRKWPELRARECIFMISK